MHAAPFRLGERTTAVPPKRLLPLLLLLATVTPMIAACGSDEGAGLDEDIAVEEVLRNASERLADTQTMAFRMSIEGTTWIDDAHTLRLLGARGTMARPNKVDVEFQVEVAGAPRVSIRMITIGEESWTTDIVTGRWVEAQEEFGYNPAILYDNQDGIGPVMGRLQDPEIVGIEDVNDVQTYHVRGTVPGEVIEPLTAGTMRGSTTTVDLWIDGENWNLVRVGVAEPKDEGIEDPATWTMNLGDHDKQVSIERPE